MDLYLNKEEQTQLDELKDAFPYAKLLWNIAIPTDNENLFVVDTADALEWRICVDDSDKGFLPKAPTALKKKLCNFYEKIA